MRKKRITSLLVAGRQRLGMETQVNELIVTGQQCVNKIKDYYTHILNIYNSKFIE